MDQVTRIPRHLIDPGPNDRTKFDPDKLADLAASIRESGLLQPILVRPQGERYEIMAGERRFRACALAGVDPIPCIVKDAGDEEAATIMLTENLGREDLDPIDEANGYQSRMTRYGWTAQGCAERGGVSIQRVNARLSLLSLRPDIQALVRTGDLKLGYASILAQAHLDTNRQALALRALRENPAPTPVWFRRIVSDLLQQQAQTHLFDLPLLGGDLASSLPPAQAKPLPPLPHHTRYTPKASTLIERAIEQVNFWATAATAWDDLGRTREARECQALADTVRDLVPPSILTKYQQGALA